MQNKDLFGESIKEELSLADKYLLTPTTVLSKRDPKWQQLKRKWMKLGIKSELGRIENLSENKGYQKDFTGITKQAFIKSGMKLYNELILIEPVGTKAMTLERGFKNGKLAKVHQNIYIFKKP